MNHSLKLACITCLSMASQATGAYNYLTDTCGTLNFNDGNMTFNYASNLTTAEKTAISTAFSRLTASSGATITTVNNNDSSFSTGNSQNEIYHDTTHGTAQCWVNYNTATCKVNEADIRFGNQTWVTGTSSDHWPYGNDGRSIMGTAVHEGGHCLGMAHENTLYNMMGDDWDHVTRNGLTTYYGPGEDLSDGLIDLHGKRSGTDVWRDVGVTVMRYAFASGAYSAHAFGALRNTSGVELPVVGSFEGQDVYEVVAGRTVRMELTFENNGEKNTETPHIGFYLSSNSTISSGDTLLATDTGYSLARNVPYENYETVTIPIGTAPGNYFLGAYVDHDDLISEVSNANNVAYYPIAVVPAASDLIVPFAGVSDNTLLPGQAFSALAIVRNDGEGTSAPSTLRYYRSTNTSISGSDSQIGTEAIAALAPGGQKADNNPATAPTTEGTWWIGACIDTVPNEANTANQCSTGTLITVAIKAPALTTEPVANITTSSVTARAAVNANGGATQLYFDYGSDNLFGNTVAYGSVGAGLGTVNANLPVTTGLICGLTYQLRARAVNSAGTTLGNVLEFTLPVCPGCAE